MHAMTCLEVPRKSLSCAWWASFSERSGFRWRSWLGRTETSRIPCRMKRAATRARLSWSAHSSSSSMRITSSHSCTTARPRSPSPQRSSRSSRLAPDDSEESSPVKRKSSPGSLAGSTSSERWTVRRLVRFKSFARSLRVPLARPSEPSVQTKGRRCRSPSATWRVEVELCISLMALKIAVWISRPFVKRSTGSGSRHLLITALIGSGNPGRTSPASSGSQSRMVMHTSGKLDPGKGSLPVQRW